MMASREKNNKNTSDQKFKTLSRAVRLVNEFLMLQLCAGLKTTENKKCILVNAG